MNQRVLLVALVVALALGLGVMAVDAQGPRPGSRKSSATLAGSAFTFQGQLKKNGALVNGTCDIGIGLWDSDTGGVQLGITQTALSVVITNGLFGGPVNDAGQFGPNAFNGDLHALQLTVRCPAGSGGYTALYPRQVLNAAPLAFALPGLYTQQNGTSPNLIGGYNGNIISNTVFGGTIGGGGLSGSENRIWDSYSTIGGGNGNLASGMQSVLGGGTGNTASALWTTVGGGAANTAGFQGATVAGGYNNTASGSHSVIAGGNTNLAGGDFSVIGGGGVNTTTNTYATVPGGRSNLASGSYSFAAGRRAQAVNQGAFVWADSTDSNFTSTGNDQFLIRAAGGVGISTTNPTANLEVAGGDLKVSKVGSAVIFPDASKQTTAALQPAFDSRRVNGTITTTEQAIVTLTIVHTGSTAIVEYGTDYQLQATSANCTSLFLQLYVDNVLQSEYGNVYVCDPGTFATNSASTINKIVRLSFGSPGYHAFKITAYSSVTNTYAYVGTGYLMVWGQ